MRLQIITPDRIVLDHEEVEAVFIQSVDGETGILPRHVPLVTALATGVLRFVKSNKKHPVAIIGGVLQTDGQTVTVLSNAAEAAEEIDTLRAQDAKNRAEARLKQSASEVDHLRAQAALQRALVRLKAKSF